MIINKAEAEINITGTDLIYDGEPKQVNVTTIPEGRDVFVTYNGEETAPITRGSYDVIVTIVNNNYKCTASASMVIGITGFSDPELVRNILVYPNPTEMGKVFIKFIKDTDLAKMEMRLLDQSGKLLERKNFNVLIKELEIDIGSYPGTYFIILLTDGNRTTSYKVFKYK